MKNNNPNETQKVDYVLDLNNKYQKLLQCVKSIIHELNDYEFTEDGILA